MIAFETKVRHLTVVETAQIIRATLKKRFPEQPFSIRSKKYSGGASIDISWQDGLRASAVNGAVAGFEGRSFDGMNDLASPQDSWLLPDGTAQLAYRPDSYGGSIPGYVSDAPHPDAELVHFGSSYIHCNRHITDFDNKHIVAEAYIREHCHCEGDRFGNEWIDSLASRMVWDADQNETIEQTFNRVVLRR